MLGKYYKHYKGGIYKVIATAYPSDNETIVEKYTKYCLGRCTETNKILDVYIDKDKNLWIYNYFNDIAIIYKDIKGTFWIRPKIIFEEPGRFIEIKNESEL